MEGPGACEVSSACVHVLSIFSRSILKYHLEPAVSVINAQPKEFHAGIALLFLFHNTALVSVQSWYLATDISILGDHEKKWKHTHILQ